MNINGAFKAALKHFQAGQLKQAEQICLEILKVQPDNADVMHFLGVISLSAENYDRAIEYMKNSLSIKPRNADALYDLGNAYHDKGQLEDAITNYQKAIETNPNFAEAFNNLGLSIQDNGKLDDAIKFYQKAIEISPDLVEAYNNLGLAFYKKGLYDEASKCYSDAMRLDPHFADPYNNFGNILEKKWQFDEALAYYQKALMLNPNAESYFNIGRIFHEKEQFDNAMDHYQKAIQLDPNLIEAYIGIGYILDYHNKRDEAIAAYDKALAHNPDLIKAIWAKCMSQLQTIYSNQVGIENSRKRYFEELKKLRDKISSLKKPHEIEAAADAVGSRQPFYLAYQGFNDKELQQIYGDLVCKIMSLKYPEFFDHLNMPHHFKGEPLRVGIVSGFFYDHSVWKIPIRGWVENIDKQRFSLYGYCTGKRKDKVTENAKKYFHHFVEDIYSFEQLCRVIKADNLHILIYPEIGMEPFTAKLAALRLAPVQCASWGHPDTSGLPTIDYYLSSALMEPAGANNHYTEKLVRLPNLSVYYTPHEVSDITLSREIFGLRPKAILYLCCQSLYKYLPQYDEIYPCIAKEIDDCQFLFISNRSQYVSEQFCQRIKHSFDKYGLKADDFIVFLPQLDQGQYNAVNYLSDIYLDSIGWSGCNSTLEAISCNLPVVTIPSKLMRGRHTSAILTMMGLTEIIATTLDDYVGLAVRLGRDAELRHQISRKIAAKKHLVYRDKTCVNTLEDFLERVVHGKLG